MYENSNPNFIRYGPVGFGMATKKVEYEENFIKVRYESLVFSCHKTNILFGLGSEIFKYSFKLRLNWS